MSENKSNDIFLNIPMYLEILKKKRKKERKCNIRLTI